MQTVHIPYIEDAALQERFQAFLTDNDYKYKIRGRGGFEKITVVEVDDAQSAFWLGTNYISLIHRLFDSNITTTLTDRREVYGGVS